MFNSKYYNSLKRLLQNPPPAYVEKGTNDKQGHEVEKFKRGPGRPRKITPASKSYDASETSVKTGKESVNEEVRISLV